MKIVFGIPQITFTQQLLDSKLTCVPHADLPSPFVAVTYLHFHHNIYTSILQHTHTYTILSDLLSGMISQSLCGYTTWRVSHGPFSA